ncbi:MAG TPA: acyltransferase [Acetobacteraceae bacterium]|nr:acyltransferase [Acetobacteraceae bacterium]
MRSHARHLDGLTGLRAFAAAWVIAYHYIPGPFSVLHIGDALPIVRTSYSIGYLGVDLFFILSGFVIWYVHGAEFARPRVAIFIRFMCLRAARLFPVYLFTVALLGVLYSWNPDFIRTPFNPAHYSPRLLLLNLALIQSWGVTGRLSWNFPAWSVSAEWFCYLLFPSLALAVARSGWRGTVAGIVLMLLGTGVLCLTVFGGSMNQSTGGMPLLRAGPEFLLGCLLRRFAGQARLTQWPWMWLIAGSIGLWLASTAAGLPPGLLAIPCFAILVLAGSTPETPVARLLSARPLVAVGAASYSLYLMQFPVEKLASALLPLLSRNAALRSMAAIAAYLVILAVCTWLVHLAVENPSRRWLRGWIDAHLPPSRRAAAVAPAGAHVHPAKS